MSDEPRCRNLVSFDVLTERTGQKRVTWHGGMGESKDATLEKLLTGDSPSSIKNIFEALPSTGSQPHLTRY